MMLTDSLGRRFEDLANASTQWHSFHSALYRSRFTHCVNITKFKKFVVLLPHRGDSFKIYKYLHHMKLSSYLCSVIIHTNFSFILSPHRKSWMHWQVISTGSRWALAKSRVYLWSWLAWPSSHTLKNAICNFCIMDTLAAGLLSSVERFSLSRWLLAPYPLIMRLQGDIEGCGL